MNKNRIFGREWHVDFFVTSQFCFLDDPSVCFPVSFSVTRMMRPWIIFMNIQKFIIQMPDATWKLSRYGIGFDFIVVISFSCYYGILYLFLIFDWASSMMQLVNLIQILIVDNTIFADISVSEKDGVVFWLIFYAFKKFMLFFKFFLGLQSVLSELITNNKFLFYFIRDQLHYNPHNTAFFHYYSDLSKSPS